MRIAAADDHGVLDAQRALSGRVVNQLRLGQRQFKARFKYRRAAAAAPVAVGAI